MMIWKRWGPEEPDCPDDKPSSSLLGFLLRDSSLTTASKRTMADQKQERPRFNADEIVISPVTKEDLPAIVRPRVLTTTTRCTKLSSAPLTDKPHSGRWLLRLLPTSMD